MNTLSAIALSLLATAASAQGDAPLTEASSAPLSRSSGGIAWYGTWSQGRAEAERTGRPILLMSAAPQCHGVPGMW